MFLKTVLNPYQGGHPTRSVLYRPNETQTYAIDAEHLHKNPRMLNAFGRGRALMIRVVDVMAYLITIASIAGSFFFAPWLFLAGFVATAAILMVNRKLAGTMARKAAAQSNEHFLYLHSQQALWLVTEPAKKVVLEAA